MDYPADINPDRVQAIAILQNTVWTPPLKKGISSEHYTTLTNKAPPRRWEPRAQIEFWPQADQVYTGRVFGIQNLADFDADGDRATIDDTMISLVALADAKGHYRQPDAPNWKARADALLTTLKAKSWGQTTFNVSDYVEDALPKPVVV